MPLYEYQCDVCTNRFERIQKFSDPPVDACPACGGAVRKLLSSPAIQFKGSGWYITDYARKTASSNDGKGGGGTAGEAKPSGDSSTSSSTATSDAAKSGGAASTDKSGS